jgi:hypothetical protein
MMDNQRSGLAVDRGGSPIHSPITKDEDAEMRIAYACSARDFAVVKGHFYLIISAIFVASICIILAGLALVRLGATGTSELKFFGVAVHSQNVGVICVIAGGAGLVIVLLRAMQQMKGILALPETGPTNARSRRRK